MAGARFGGFMGVLRQSVLVSSPYAYLEAGWLVPAQPVIEEAHFDLVADQPGGDGIKDLVDIDRAVARDLRRDRREVRGAAPGQGIERLALGGDRLGATGVVTVADPGDEGAVGFDAVEIPASPAPQPLVEADLDVAVGGFDAAVLVGYAGIVASGLHAVVPAQVVVALGEIKLGVAVEVFESRRQRVGSVLARNAAQLPKRVLQAFGDG